MKSLLVNLYFIWRQKPFNLKSLASTYLSRECVGLDDAKYHVVPLWMLLSYSWMSAPPGLSQASNTTIHNKLLHTHIHCYRENQRKDCRYRILPFSFNIYPPPAMAKCKILFQKSIIRLKLNCLISWNNSVGVGTSPVWSREFSNIVSMCL